MTRQSSKESGVNVEAWNIDAFSERFREAMKGRTPYSIQKQTGIAQSLIGKYMTGSSTPGTDKLVVLANVLGVSVTWLATGEGPKPYKEEIKDVLDLGEHHSTASHGSQATDIREDQEAAIAFTGTPKRGATGDYEGRNSGEPVRVEEQEAYFERARKADVADAMPNVVAIPTTLYARLAGPLAELVPNEKHREPVLETTLEILRAATRNNVVDMLHLDEGDLRNAVGLAVSACTLVLDRQEAQDKALRAALKANARPKREDSEES